MNMEELGSKLKDLFSKGTKASKEALEKAGDKVQDFTDKSVTKIEIHKLETKRDCKYEEMGLKLSQMLLEGASITSSNADDIKILNDIKIDTSDVSVLPLFVALGVIAFFVSDICVRISTVISQNRLFNILVLGRKIK